MYQVLVVDDEVHVCQLICHLVDWNGLEVKLCGVANNGVEALELIQEQRPQIIISDIRMSGMDGISLLEQVRKAGMNCKVILVSGYREFDYAQRALQLGATDYLVKPINKNALNRAVKKSISELENEAPQVPFADQRKEQLEKNPKQGTMSRLVAVLETEAPVMDSASLWEIAQKQNMVLPPDPVLYCWKLVTAEPYAPELLPRLYERITQAVMGGSYQNVCCTKWSQGGLFLLGADSGTQNPADLQRRLQEAVSPYPSWKVLLSMCRPNRNEPLRQSVRRAEHGVQKHYFRPLDVCFEADIVLHTPRFETVAEKLRLPELSEAMKLLDRDGVLVHVSENLGVLEQYGSSEILFSYAEWLIDAMNHALSAFAVTQTGLEHIPYLRKKEVLETLLHCPALSNFGVRLRGMLESCIQTMRQDLEQMENKPVRMVRQMVDLHYMDHISLNDAAEAVDLNPVYLSGLFKKETGINFKDYLTNVRMEKAKELLRHGDSINCVAEQVGYQDTKYFSKLFTRVVGVNPTQYKKLYS